MKVHIIRYSYSPEKHFVRTPVSLDALSCIEFETDDGACFKVSFSRDMVDTITIREITTRVLLPYHESGTVIHIIGQRWKTFMDIFCKKEKSP